jgi:DNA-binding LacI/PurR family transcriptional regulator
MSRGRTNIIGIVFPHGVRKPWYPGRWSAAILNSVTDAVNNYHKNLLLYTDQDYALPGADTSTLTDHRCDGLLLFGFQLSEPLLHDLTTASVPFVMVNNMSSDPKSCSVDIDNTSAARHLTLHLLEMGHRNIAVYGTYLDYYWAQLRLDACRATLEEAGLSLPNENYIRNANPSELVNREALETMLARPVSTRPTAIICMNDELALSVMNLMRELDVPVPQSISIAGFDDIEDSIHSVPSLTTIRQPLDQIGYRSVEVLLGLVAGTLQSGYNEVLPTSLVIRDSVASLNR